MNRPTYYAHSEYTSAMQDACDSSTSVNARPHCRLMGIQGHAFWDTDKPTMCCVSLCNNVGRIFKVSEEIASENSENRLCRQPHCRLTPPLQGIPANICINVVFGLCNWKCIMGVKLGKIGKESSDFDPKRIRSYFSDPKNFIKIE